MLDRLTTVSFTGHRTYGGEADDALCRTVVELYACGYRTFLCGMAVGFDLAAARTLLTCRERLPELCLIAVVPFRGQEACFPTADRLLYDRVLAAADETMILSDTYHRGCYAVRNNYLVDHAALLVAWYDGSSGGTDYTVRRARRHGLEIRNLAPDGPQAVAGRLF